MDQNIWLGHCRDSLNRLNVGSDSALSMVCQLETVTLLDYITTNLTILIVGWSLMALFFFIIRFLRIGEAEFIMERA